MKKMVGNYLHGCVPGLVLDDQVPGTHTGAEYRGKFVHTDESVVSRPAGRPDDLAEPLIDPERVRVVYNIM